EGDLRVPASDRELLVPGGECQSADVATMFADLRQFLPGCRIPQPHGLVEAPRGESLAVAGERDRVHFRGMPLKLTDLLARCRIPETHDRVVARGGQYAPVRRVGHGVHVLALGRPA